MRDCPGTFPDLNAAPCQAIERDRKMRKRCETLADGRGRVAAQNRKKVGRVAATVALVATLVGLAGCQGSLKTPVIQFEWGFAGADKDGNHQ